LYSMKPSLGNLFMKKFTRERVVPIISASNSCDSFGNTRCGDPRPLRRIHLQQHCVAASWSSSSVCPPRPSTPRASVPLVREHNEHNEHNQHVQARTFVRDRPNPGLVEHTLRIQR